jgi:hypothetical protein
MMNQHVLAYFYLSVTLVQKSMAALLSDHSSHDMLSLTLFVINFLLKNGAIRIKLLLKAFDEFTLLWIFLLKIHRIG